MGRPLQLHFLFLATEERNQMMRFFPELLLQAKTWKRDDSLVWMLTIWLLYKILFALCIAQFARPSKLHYACGVPERNVLFLFWNHSFFMLVNLSRHRDKFSTPCFLFLISSRPHRFPTEQTAVRCFPQVAQRYRVFCCDLDAGKQKGPLRGTTCMSLCLLLQNIC